MSSDSRNFYSDLAYDSSKIARMGGAATVFLGSIALMGEAVVTVVELYQDAPLGDNLLRSSQYLAVMALGALISKPGAKAWDTFMRKSLEK